MPDCPSSRASSPLSPPPATPSPLRPTSSSPKPTSGPNDGSGEPPKKKKRLTAAEKAAKAQAIEEEKRKRQEERERKRQEKEEAEKKKAAEKAARAAEKAEREQEKKQKQEERERKKREKEEEEAKKARSQLKLTSMFTKTTVPKPQSADNKMAKEGADAPKKEKTFYEQMFKPFFIKENVRMAPNYHEIDEETREAKAKALDEYLLNGRQEPLEKLDLCKTLGITTKRPRGRVYPSVRKIMTEFNQLTSGSIPNLSAERQNEKLRKTLEILKTVPVKSIKFKEDVRPPYIGTISGLPPGGQSLRKLARRPNSRNVLTLNYDYDSEAEWQDEEGEDIEDLDDEEEDIDMDDDMADFLDDSEDVGPQRKVLDADMEPQAIGPCFEDVSGRNPNPELHQYALEVLISKPPCSLLQLINMLTDSDIPEGHSIDPWSTAYWDSPKSKTKETASEASTSAANTSNSAAGASSSASAAQSSGPGRKKAQPLSAEMEEKLKDLVRSNPALSKLGIVEVFASQNPSCSRAQIKASFDLLFEKSGKGFKVKGE